MTPERHAKICAVLDKRQPDLTVVADEIHKGRNMAAIVRTCDAVGVAKMYSVVPAAGYKSYRGTALGANKWVDVALCDSLNEPLHKLKHQGFQIVSTALEPSACDYRDVDYTLPTALVMGNEKCGISDTARAMTDTFVTIPMIGMVESLNVSVAAAIILNEALYQRRKAGMLDKSRLPKNTYDELFFRWAHPQVAQFCDERSLRYPAMADNGEIADPVGWHNHVKVNNYHA